MALKSSQYDAIMKRYEQTRDHNRALAEDRLAEVYTAIPEYEQLDASVASLSVSMGKQMLAGDDEALDRLKASLSDIADRKHALLKEHGYAADYLEPIYTCPLCQDTGYTDGPDGVRIKCNCFRRQEIALRYEQSNIQELLATENFSTLSYDYYQGEDLEHFRRAVEICKNFVQNFEQDYHNLFFYGTVGTGKSFLSGCVANELLQSGRTVVYFSAQGLFDALAFYSFEEKSKEALHSFYDDLYNCDLLIIDDLGTELTNAFVTSQLFSCLNERHLRRKATVISTNLSLEEMHNRYSDRIFSRIVNQYQLCKLTGPDIRIQRYVARNHVSI